MVFISLTMEVKVLSSGLPFAQEAQICWTLVLYVSHGFGGNHIYIHVFFFYVCDKEQACFLSKFAVFFAVNGSKIACVRAKPFFNSTPISKHTEGNRKKM
jgi:hypothetical protein